MADKENVPPVPTADAKTPPDADSNAEPDAEFRSMQPDASSEHSAPTNTLPQTAQPAPFVSPLQQYIDILTTGRSSAENPSEQLELSILGFLALPEQTQPVLYPNDSLDEQGNCPGCGRNPFERT